MRNICCGHKFCVRDTKNVSDSVQMFPSLHNPGNMSSFTMALILRFMDGIDRMEENKLCNGISVVFTFRLVDLDGRFTFIHLQSVSFFLELLKSMECTKNRTNFNEETSNLTFMGTRQNVFPLSAKLARKLGANCSRC